MEDTVRRPSKAARTRKLSLVDASAPDVVMVPIVVTVDPVYLPLDAEGNGRADWRDTGKTSRVVKRARLGVPADLARFLSDRDQAEILSAPLETSLSAPLKAGL
jgi:hypothetical protein